VTKEGKVDREVAGTKLKCWN